MTLPEYIREIAFWGLDRIKGSPIGKHMKDLDQAFADPKKGRELAAGRLKLLLDHASTTTEFYKSFAGKSLDEFPVIPKRTIKENYNKFLSSKFQKHQLATTTTSGSYGMPFTFYLTKEKRARQQAEVLFFSRFAGYRVGMKFAHIRAQERGWLTLFLQNSHIMNPCIIDEQWLEKQRQLFKKKGIKAVVAYPSSIIPIISYCLSRGDKPEDFKMVSVICSAETLSSLIRSKIKELFGCTILDRYSSNELGTVSHELTENGPLYTNFISHKIELLKIDSNEPVIKPGEVGRVVVTDLDSYAMPLIRYDTGDLAVWLDKDKCDRDIPAFERIEGRIVETLTTPEGKKVNFSAIDIVPKYFSEIIQFQFIQKTKNRYLIKLQVMDVFEHEAKLLQNCKDLFGKDAHFDIEYIDNIEPLPSGKRPYVINEYERPDRD